MDILAAMRVYVRVVERGSLSAAARDLGVGQPSVSERIERLEAQLGTRLLRRSTRALSVTDAGAAFYERSKRAIDAAEEALACVQEPRVLQGSVRIAAPHGIGEIFLPKLILGLRDRHPGLTFDLVLNDRLVDPVTEGVDLSLRLGDPGMGGFVARKIAHVRRVLVASPDYVRRHGLPRVPDDLARHGFARVAGLFTSNTISLLSAEGRTVSAAIDVAITVSHWRPLHACLIGGGAIGVLQEPVCADDLKAGRLVRLLPDHEVPGFDLHLIYPADVLMPARIKMIRDALAQGFPAMLA